MSNDKTGFLSIAEAFSEKEIFEMVRGSIRYVETLLEEKIDVPFEDIVAELWTDEALFHTPKIDPYRLKQNQRSFVMRGMVWRLRDYIVETRYQGLAVSLPDRSQLRRLEEKGFDELLASLKEGAQHNIDSDHVGDTRSLDEILEVARLHDIVKKRTPTIWGLMVAAGLSEDKRLTVKTLTDVRKNLQQRMDIQAKREGRKSPKLSKEDFAQHLKLEVRSFCRATNSDFDNVWWQVALMLSKVRSSRRPYKKTVKKVA
jgi:hypothetical protein